MNSQKPLIEIRTGSDSDIPKIRAAYDFLKSMNIPFSPRILSAHRTPKIMAQEAQKLSENGFLVSIAAAGGSAHLPGMTASETLIPLVGLPVKTTNLEGQDSLYSIIQMPDGVPVGSVAAGQSESAAIVAAQIAYHNNPEVRNRIRAYRGLEGEIASEIPTVPLVGIVKPSGIKVDEKKYREMMVLMEEFGLKVTEYQLSVIDFNGVKVISREMEDNGTMAVIALGALADEDTTNYFPGFIAESTDLPTIGLPITRSFAGSDFYIKGDIFQSMLSFSEPGEETRGYPVAGMGINRYTNAALYAAQIAGLFIPKVQEKVRVYRNTLAEAVKDKDARIQAEGIEAFL
ncbi:MAG TPA: 5-(carboxyamino)imidazole ribonucleotide mutase [Candidatus Nanoarchaeia archaeon]|nr:5-(carboxyamino)imidazole ribonucleotide mutase [Candidatus Nanoarchaeia archaeon]